MSATGHLIGAYCRRMTPVDFLAMETNLDGDLGVDMRVTCREVREPLRMGREHLYNSFSYRELGVGFRILSFGDARTS
jgi:hypothetical protein